MNEYPVYEKFLSVVAIRERGFELVAWAGTAVVVWIVLFRYGWPRTWQRVRNALPVLFYLSLIGVMLWPLLFGS